MGVEFRGVAACTRRLGVCTHDYMNTRMHTSLRTYEDQSCSARLHDSLS